MEGVLQIRTVVLSGSRLVVENPELIEGAEVLVTITTPPSVSPEQEIREVRLARFHRWVDSHKSMNLPELAPEAYKRERFYGDRG